MGNLHIVINQPPLGLELEGGVRVWGYVPSQPRALRRQTHPPCINPTGAAAGLRLTDRVDAHGRQDPTAPQVLGRPC